MRVADDGYLLDERSIRRIAAAVAAFERTGAPAPRIVSRRPDTNERIAIPGVAASPITRGSLSAPTTFTFTPYAPSGDDVDAAWVAEEGEGDYDGVELGLLPAAHSPLPAGRQIRVVWSCGRWVLDNADCPEE